MMPAIQEHQVTLPNGQSAQVFLFRPSISVSKPKGPPLVFLHGSFHAAWCWTEHFFPHFGQQNYTVVALSWRGTGGTPVAKGVKKVPIAQHVDDLRGFLQTTLPELLHQDEDDNESTSTMPPVLISHSFGGIVVMKYLEALFLTEKSIRLSDHVSGIVSMCSVPPSGNGKMTARYLKRSLKDSWKITTGFAMKQCLTNPQLCRDLFFGPESEYGVIDADIGRYQSYFARDSVATIDLFDLAKQLPSKTVDAQGRAPFFVEKGKSYSSSIPSRLVMGATDDFIVDKVGNEETAQYYNIEEVVYVKSPHDIMLASEWKQGAAIIDDFLQGIIHPL